MIEGMAVYTLSVASCEKRSLDRGSALTTPRLVRSGASLTADCRASNLVSPQVRVRRGKSAARRPARPSDTTVRDRIVSL